MSSDHGSSAQLRDDAPVTAQRDLDSARAVVAETVTIARSAEDLFAFWRDPANLVPVLENVVSIEPIDPRRSRWTVKAPGGSTRSWVSVITDEVENRELTWQSDEGADVANSGRIEFVPAGARGTVVRATIAYESPAGAIGQVVAKLFQREPRIQARRDLHRFKQLMEAGEVATGARNARERAEREGGAR